MTRHIPCRVAINLRNEDSVGEALLTAPDDPGVVQVAAAVSVKVWIRIEPSDLVARACNPPQGVQIGALVCTEMRSRRVRVDQTKPLRLKRRAGDMSCSRPRIDGRPALHG